MPRPAITLTGTTRLPWGGTTKSRTVLPSTRQASQTAMRSLPESGCAERLLSVTATATGFSRAWTSPGSAMVTVSGPL